MLYRIDTDELYPYHELITTHPHVKEVEVPAKIMNKYLKAQKAFELARNDLRKVLREIK